MYHSSLKDNLQRLIHWDLLVSAVKINSYQSFFWAERLLQNVKKSKLDVIWNSKLFVVLECCGDDDWEGLTRAEDLFKFF